ncbi:uncharacterized protein EHS24_005809 [Apiotrichum porosum]|uniref:Uncharacterized protein n=1 Tax=Apiotrichum porosum TaxID=105984 RepID=A0A427XZH1_9TREE|nr:uncharacterized protein EHS24_005809 [Apiotrichum porosum]RSH84294.1 hypothetical protein EHS24_005809 [Apiotrichum porosum]
MRDGDDIAAKKAALSKALSAAYLEHQIADLESKVQSIGVNGGNNAAAARRSFEDRPVEKDKHKDKRGDRYDYYHDDDDDDEKHHADGREWRQGPSDDNGRGHSRGKHDHGDRPDKGFGRGHHHKHHGHHHSKHGRIDDSSASSDSDSEGEWEWRVAVVDVSALMWAPHSVRRLVHRGYEVIVPLDAIRTLDMLKKGNSPVAQAARAAARFAEHASRHWRPVSADPSIAVQAGTDYKKGRGLRLQRDDEASAPPAAAGGDPPPKWVASVLGCAAFFTAISRAEEAAQGLGDEPRPAVLIAHPPLSAEVGPPPVDERPDAPPAQAQHYAERAEGYTLSLEAGRFELGLEVLRDEEEADFDTAGATRGRGRGGRGGRGRHGGGHGQGGGGHGHGRGGRGRGRNAEPEPEPVKILLRRPEPEAGNEVPPSPTFAVNPTMTAKSELRNERAEYRELRAEQREQRAEQRAEHHAQRAELRAEQREQRAERGERGERGRGAGGGGGRGRGGRGRGRGSTQERDRGGAFTLLQRPGPPLAHHVRNIDQAAPAPPSGGGRSPAAPEFFPRGPPPPSLGHWADGPHHGHHGRAEPDMPPHWRRAYASADADPVEPRVVLLQRPR